MHDAMRRREAQDHTVKLAISSATDKKRQMVEDVCGVETVPSMAIVYEQSKRQRIQQQLSPLASDDFPSDMELRDVHTQMLFHVRLEDEFHRLDITG